jgi:hypothetical protein
MVLLTEEDNLINESELDVLISDSIVDQSNDKGIKKRRIIKKKRGPPTEKQKEQGWKNVITDAV